MTVQEAKDKFLQWVAEQVGYSEGANNYNKYAEDKRLVQLYGWDAQNQPWCDLFTDAAFIHCFGLETAAAMTYQPIGDGSAACWRSAQFFKEHGAFSQYPEAGDVAFFYVNGAINHQGIVESVSGGIVHTIEGFVLTKIESVNMFTLLSNVNVLIFESYVPVRLSMI